ncbi:hypothetical protein Axi01nite_49710 [Actinoplanes xinjiangensis]|nr:hypothetical protein Axi01nite_49710 [Actinoplanes xinjiangensis]
MNQRVTPAWAVGHAGVTRSGEFWAGVRNRHCLSPLAKDAPAREPRAEAADCRSATDPSPKDVTLSDTPRE